MRASLAGFRTLAGFYLVTTATITGGLYLPLFVDPASSLTFVPEAVYVWTVLFFVPFLILERFLSLFVPASGRAPEKA